MAEVGRDLKDHGAPTPYHKQGCQLLNQAAWGTLALLGKPKKKLKQEHGSRLLLVQI